jgi:hypothetical protein
MLVPLGRFSLVAKAERPDPSMHVTQTSSGM